MNPSAAAPSLKSSIVLAHDVGSSSGFSQLGCLGSNTANSGGLMFFHHFGSEFDTSIDPERAVDVWREETVPQPDALAGQFEISFHSCPSEIEVEWRALELIGAGSAFQSFDWCMAWASASRDVVRENPLIVAGRCRSGQIAFILPMALYCHFGICSLRWLGQDRAAYNMGLFREDCLTQFDARSLTTIIARIKKKFPSVAATKLLSQPRMFEGRRNPFSRLETTCSGVLGFETHTAKDFPTFAAEILSSRQRKLLRGKRKKLGVIGHVEHQIASTTVERLNILETFLGQKAIQLGERGVRNVFNNVIQQRLFRNLATLESGDTDNAPEFHALLVGGMPIATLVGQRFQSTFYVHAISMTSDSLGRFSPGQILMHDVLERQVNSGATRVNFGPGGGRHKESWGPQSIELFETHRTLRPSGLILTTYSTLRANGKFLLKRRPRLASLVRTLDGWIRLRPHARARCHTLPDAS